MKIHTGDKVQVITGKDKGKQGTVSRVYVKKGKVLIEGINQITRHIRRTAQNEGGQIKLSKPVDVSNVRLIDPKSDQPTRVGYKIVDGKKYRVAKKSGEIVGKTK